MRRHGYAAHVLIGALLVFLFVLVSESNPVSAQACTQKASAARDTPLYQQAPQFITGRGVVYASQTTVLRKGIPVFLCGQTTVGFWPASQVWYRIAYWSKGWVYAWVAARDILTQGSGRLRPRTAGVPVVLAASAPSPNLGVVSQSPEVGAPQQPPPGQTPPPAPGFESAIRTDDSALRVFYAMSFIAILIGMAAKTLVDVFESSGPMQRGQIVRETMVPLLVSPMVFLGFMQSASLKISGNGGFIVLLCLAFQSGFFWQTVLNIKKAQ